MNALYLASLFVGCTARPVDTATPDDTAEEDTALTPPDSPGTADSGADAPLEDTSCEEPPQADPLSCGPPWTDSPDPYWPTLPPEDAVVPEFRTPDGPCGPHSWFDDQDVWLWGWIDYDWFFISDNGYISSTLSVRPVRSWTEGNAHYFAWWFVVDAGTSAQPWPPRGVVTEFTWKCDAEGVWEVRQRATSTPTNWPEEPTWDADLTMHPGVFLHPRHPGTHSCWNQRFVARFSSWWENGCGQWEPSWTIDQARPPFQSMVSPETLALWSPAPFNLFASEMVPFGGIFHRKTRLLQPGSAEAWTLIRRYPIGGTPP